MSCCKENEIYLNWKNNYDQPKVINELQTIFGWTYLQSSVVVEIAQKNNKCLLIRETRDRISELTVKMAQCGLSFQVTELTKIK